MALIKTFRKVSLDRPNLHRTSAECGYAIIERDGRRVVQLDTYGSRDRQRPGKTSQTLQVDAASARKLRAILDQAFPS